MRTVATIRKAIVAVAGAGTRFLPATKTMPKEMLPIVDKPIIQLVVEELVEAGYRILSSLQNGIRSLWKTTSITTGPWPMN